MKHTEAFLVGLGGILLGATVALLFAPKKGDHLRSDIKKFLKEKGLKIQKGKLEELVEEIVDEIK